MARYNFILFDADDTLFDFEVAERHALRTVLEGQGFPLTAALVARYHAINRDLWARFDRGEVAQSWLLVERFAVLLKELCSDTDPAALNLAYLRQLGTCGALLLGAEDLCRALGAHCTMAIVTNGALIAQKGRFEASPIRPLFSRLFISEEMGIQKPQKQFFDVVCRDMGITDRARAVVVGDNLRTDILGGVNAGIDTIWYNPRRMPTDRSVVPTWEAHCFADIARIILDHEQT